MSNKEEMISNMAYQDFIIQEQKNKIEELQRKVQILLNAFGLISDSVHGIIENEVTKIK